MTRYFILIIFLVFFVGTQHSNAQNNLSDFLLTSFEDLNTRGFDKSIDFLSPKNYRLPLIEDIEFRYGNDEFTNEDQQYALRFRPGNPWKIRRNNALFNATKKELNIRKRLQYKENLEDRYEIAADYILKTQLLDIQKQHYYIIAKRVEVLGSNMESALFDAKDFVEAKLDQVDALNNQEEANTSLIGSKNTIISILQNTGFDWSSNTLISVSAIDSISDHIIAKEIPSLELDLISQEIEVAKSEVRLEKADFNLGFIQTEYFPFKDRNSDYGVSFGLSIPLFKANKNQIAERKLDEIELNGELLTEQYQDSVKRIIEYEYLKNLIIQHESLLEQIDQLDLQKLSRDLSQIVDNNPLSLLKIQEGALKLKELELRSYRRVIDQYLEFLTTFNALTQLPLTNYISEQLESLE